jgi:hypothetical protein
LLSFYIGKLHPCGGSSVLIQYFCLTSLISRGSVCHVHGLVIYKDVDNPVSKNESLKDELEIVKGELMKQWDYKSQLWVRRRIHS